MPRQPLAQVPSTPPGSGRSTVPAVTPTPRCSSIRRTSEDSPASAATVPPSVCARCDVRSECADYVIRAREPYGVWGRLTRRKA